MNQLYPRSFQINLTNAASTKPLQFVSSDLSGQATDFRVSFIVSRGDTLTPNTCDVRIYNLSETTMNLINSPTGATGVSAEFNQISLSAGYAGNIGLIFRGNIKQVRKGRVDAKDSYIDITAADGDEAYNFAAMSLAIAAGHATPANLVEAYLGSLALGAQSNPNSQQIIAGYGADGSLKWPNQTPARPKVLFGRTSELIRKFGRDMGVTASIQDGALTFVPLTAYAPGEIPVVSVGTGLVGVPEWQQNGLHIRTLLNANLKLCQIIQLQAAATNAYKYSLELNSDTENQAIKNVIKNSPDGLYYVMAADHIGDSRGQEWYTDLICLSADSTVVNQNVPQNALIDSAAQSVDVPTQPPNTGSNSQ